MTQMYNKYSIYYILDEEIAISSEEVNGFRNAVAEIKGNFYYLGNESDGISSAIFAWQEVNGRELTGDELHQVMVDNHLLSEAI